MRTLISLLVIYCCLIETKCQSGGRCSTGRNEPGTCINVYNCPYVIGLIKTHGNSAGTREYVKNSICSQQGSTIFICCRDEPESPTSDPKSSGQNTNQSGDQCTTSRNEAGTCTHVYKCPYVLHLVSTHGSDPATKDYLKRSVCGREGYDIIVCCPISSPSSTPPQKNETSLLPTPPNCGVSAVEEHVRIMGGTPAKLGSWPWMASIGYRIKNKPPPTFSCGGSVIHKRYVLTAAHCSPDTGKIMYMVRLGDLNLNKAVEDGANAIDMPTDKFIRHEKYSIFTLQHDIALIKLKKDIDFAENELIRPICLPISEPHRSSDYRDRYMFVAGWGTLWDGGPNSEKLLQAQVKVIDNESCSRSYKKKNSDITKLQICAGTEKGGVDTCKDDSGGPMMLPHLQGPSVSYYQIGVVSFGSGCGDPNFPGVYTRVSEYIEWIHDKIQTS